MADKNRDAWIDRAVLSDALSTVSDQWLKDVYDMLSVEGYADEVIYPLMRDLMLNPEVLNGRMREKNVFWDDDRALNSVIKDMAGIYEAAYGPDTPGGEANMYALEPLRDRMKFRRSYPFLDVDALNNRRFTTSLNPKDEESFRNWFSGYADSHGVDPDPDEPEHFYDARGWWKEADEQERFSVMSDPSSHLSDRYKMPGHPTFSDESVYHDPSRPETTGGHWDGGYFRPSPWQREQRDRYVYDANERKMRQRYTESAFKDDAYMPTSKARGAYQIAPGAYADYVKATGRKGDLNDARFNSEVRDWYMDRLPSYIGKDVYDEGDPEDVRLAKIYAAYNWGAGNLNKHLRRAQDSGVDVHDSLDWIEGMPKETRDYVNFIVLGRDSTDRLRSDKFDAAVAEFNNR